MIRPVPLLPTLLLALGALTAGSRPAVAQDAHPA